MINAVNDSEMALIDVHNENGNLVTIVNDEPRVSTLVIAEKLGLTHQNVLRNIDTYKAKIESLGLLGFEIRARLEGQHGGGDTRYALLNEDQTLFLITLSRNTDRVVDFKLALTKAFSKARAQLQNKDKDAPKEEAPKLIIKDMKDLGEFVRMTRDSLEPLGLEGNQLTLSLDRLVIAKTGESMLQLTGLDKKLKSPTQELMLNPTELGKEIGLTARKVNAILEAKGYQVKTENHWSLTQKGKDAGGIYLDVGKRHNSGSPVQQIRWPQNLQKDLVA